MVDDSSSQLFVSSKNNIFPSNATVVDPVWQKNWQKNLVSSPLSVEFPSSQVTKMYTSCWLSGTGHWDITTRIELDQKKFVGDRCKNYLRLSTFRSLFGRRLYFPLWIKKVYNSRFRTTKPGRPVDWQLKTWESWDKLADIFINSGIHIHCENGFMFKMFISFWSIIYMWRSYKIITFLSDYNKCIDEPEFCLNGATCEQTWTYARCHCTSRFQGDLCDVCSEKFQGVGCQECSPRFQGNECQECSERFQGNGCQECTTRFQGDECQQCSDRFQGDNCQQCSFRFQGQRLSTVFFEIPG